MAKFNPFPGAVWVASASDYLSQPHGLEAVTEWCEANGLDAQRIPMSDFAIFPEGDGFYAVYREYWGDPRDGMTTEWMRKDVDSIPVVTA